MILWTSWYKIEEEHEKEVLKSIELNLENPFLTKLNLLCEIPFIYQHPKLECIFIEKRPSYQTFLDLYDFKNINILINSDIVLDYKTSYLIQKIPTNSAYCLTKYQLLNDYKLPLKEWKCSFYDLSSGSTTQDAWIIYKPLNPIKNCSDILMGIPGCENRFSLCLYNSGLIVSNPSLSIQIIHNHLSETRNYTESYHEKYPGLAILPTSLQTKFSLFKKPPIKTLAYVELIPSFENKDKSEKFIFKLI
jgi:hypothetical protein